MRNWSSLTPNLSSWINAFLLATLLIIATSLIPIFHSLWTILASLVAGVVYFLILLPSLLISFLVSILPQFIQFIITGIISFISSILSNIIALISPVVALVSALILLLPIPIIAFAHHYLYLLLDRYYPDLTPAERGQVTGYFPGIVSWWHGLYGLLVIILALLFSDAVLSIFPWLNLKLATIDFQLLDLGISASNRIDTWIRIALMILGQPIYQPLLRLVIWIAAAAYLYQFEFTFRQHLISSASSSAGSDR
ncbi:MAG: hypothetical protein AAGF83_08070 [Cyanobacteria bacterium P01_G01_bin.67]